MILDAFEDEMDQTVKIYSQSKGYNDVTGTSTSIPKLEVTVLAGYWTASSGEQFISDRFRALVDGVVVISPDTLNNYVINDSDTIVINNVTYNVVYSDDIMFQGEVITVGVKRL
jgi:hypothetical protein